MQKYYPEYKEIIRTVVLYGGNKDTIERVEVSFLLNRKGQMVLAIFKEAIANLLDYWHL